MKERKLYDNKFDLNLNCSCSFKMQHIFHKVIWSSIQLQKNLIPYDIASKVVSFN